MLLTLGTGVGGGLVRCGSLDRGSHGLAAEFGHLPVDASGDICSCGAHGCLEVYASGTALAAGARRHAGQAGAAAIVALAGGLAADITARHVVAAARAGDALGLQLLAGIGSAVGRAVAMAMPAIDPDLVVLAGSLATSAADLILVPARAELSRSHPLPAVLGPVPIVLGQAGAAAAALGAAELARGAFATAREPAPPARQDSWPAGAGRAGASAVHEGGSRA